VRRARGSLPAILPEFILVSSAFVTFEAQVTKAMASRAKLEREETAARGLGVLQELEVCATVSVEPLNGVLPAGYYA
jgi:hypothetical protein